DPEDRPDAVILEARGEDVRRAVAERIDYQHDRADVALADRITRILRCDRKGARVGGPARYRLLDRIDPRPEARIGAMALAELQSERRVDELQSLRFDPAGRKDLQELFPGVNEPAAIAPHVKNQSVRRQ